MDHMCIIGQTKNWHESQFVRAHFDTSSMTLSDEGWDD